MVADFEVWFVRIRNDSFFSFAHLSRQWQLVLHFLNVVDHQMSAVFLVCLQTVTSKGFCATDLCTFGSRRTLSAMKGGIVCELEPPVF